MRAHAYGCGRSALLLQGQSSQPDAAVLLEQAGQVQKALHKASARQVCPKLCNLLLSSHARHCLAANAHGWTADTAAQPK